jgi:hypothetical protein
MLGLLLSLAAPLFAQTPASGSNAQPDGWKVLSFLEGTWEAKGQGPGRVCSTGAYTFQMELGKHVLARHSTTDPGCEGPVTSDCAHGDLLDV